MRTARELKKVKGILAKPAQKQGKMISQNTIDLVLSMYEDDEVICQILHKKNVSIANRVHKQKRIVLCNLREIYAAFKEKYPNVMLGFSKFCIFRPKWYVFAGSSGTHSVSVCSIHQNAILLVDAMSWDITYKDLILKIVCDSTRKEGVIHRFESCPGRAGLKQFLDEQLSDVDSDSEIHYNQWDTTDQA